MKLELKHIAPYLPYKVKVYNSNAYPLCGLFEMNHNGGAGMIAISELLASPKLYKIALRSMYDLEDSSKNYLNLLNELGQKVEYKGGYFSDGVALFDDPCWLPYVSFEFLLENHFDVFGLIDHGLAIDINHL